MKRIDAHQHFWRLADRGGSWPPADLAAVYRDFLPHDLTPLLAAHGITGTVLVQSQPTVADTHFMLQVAHDTPAVLGVVGWADMKAPDAPEQIAQLARHGKLKGLRPMLQDCPDDAWIADVALAPAIDAMLRHGLSLDALVFPRHLPFLLRFAERFPALPIVIDHAAKPPIASGQSSNWAADMARLAALPQVCSKLSGLVTEADPNWSIAHLRPYADHLVAAFGPQRVLWGSDWPVVNLAGDYARWFDAAERLLHTLSEDARAQVFGLNAIRFYRLD